MQNAGLKVLRLQYGKMLAQQAGVQAGDDIEAVHDMRVAMRRMRVALRVFKPYFPKSSLKRYGKRVKAVGRVLGPIRDIDVFLEKTNLYSEQDAQNQQTLASVEDFFGKARDEFHVEANLYLESQTYADLVKSLENFTETEEIDSGPIVRASAQKLIGKRLSKVRGYEQDWRQADYVTLHRLRIAFKRLRYSIEFFEDVLGKEQYVAIKLLKEIQDHLGDLNDAQVALLLLEDLPGEYKNPHSQAYYDFRRGERDALVASFPDMWQRFANGGFENNLEMALRPLNV